jgi:hypothetical protein
LYLTLSGKPCPADIPDIADTGEIYLCAPVWGGKIAAPGQYFIDNSDLKDKKLNILLTCDSITSYEKYKKNAEKVLESKPCINGIVHVFAAGKYPTDKETLTGQLRDILA